MRPVRFVLDAGEIHATLMNWDHFGGLDKYLNLLDYCADWAARTQFGAQGPLITTGDSFADEPYREPPASSAREKRPGTGIIRELPREGVAGEAADGVRLFLDTCCEVGDEYRSPAKDLYACYLEWCNETGRRQPRNAASACVCPAWGSSGGGGAAANTGGKASGWPPPPSCPWREAAAKRTEKSVFSAVGFRPFPHRDGSSVPVNILARRNCRSNSAESSTF